VSPSHLMDRALFDFARLAAGGLPDPEGDKAFDADPITDTAMKKIRIAR